MNFNKSVNECLLCLKSGQKRFRVVALSRFCPQARRRDTSLDINVFLEIQYKQQLD